MQTPKIIIVQIACLVVKVVNQQLLAPIAVMDTSMSTKFALFVELIALNAFLRILLLAQSVRLENSYITRVVMMFVLSVRIKMSQITLARNARLVVRAVKLQTYAMLATRKMDILSFKALALVVKKIAWSAIDRIPHFASRASKENTFLIRVVMRNVQQERFDILNLENVYLA